MTVIKGFFFDLDGTLVDTHEANYLAYRGAVESVKSTTLGPELKARIMAGESSSSFLPALLSDASNDEIDDINLKKKELYLQHLEVSKLNNFLSIFLQQISEHHTTALVTTAKRHNALAVLQHYDLERYFTFMIFGDDVEFMKPHPDAYLLALERAGLMASEAIAFEDSSKGIQAAEAAGVATVHIRNFL